MFVYSSIERALHADLQLSDALRNGPMSSDMDPQLIARRELASSFGKKFRPKGGNDAADKAALKKFLAVNDSIKAGPFVFEVEDFVDDYLWDYFRNNLDDFLCDPLEISEEPHELEFSTRTLLRTAGIGPGSSQLADSRTFYSKLFSGVMSVGNECLIPLYRSALAEHDTWAAAERHRFENFGFVSVAGTKIFFVPKNSDISRVCGTEANMDMFIQKAIGGNLEERLKRYFSIDLEDQQSINRALARQGSIDGSITTLDQESASDYISVSMFDAAVRYSSLKRWILMSRSKCAVLPDGSRVELKMVSTMGNGFTFPLQTAIFACAVKAVYQLLDIKFRNGTTFGVFGDDICVVKRAESLVIRLLTKLGQRINQKKSFGSGFFRESCGGDYYMGVNVRGVYCLSLDTSLDVAGLFNRLTRWSARTGWHLPETFRLLNLWRIRNNIPLVPPSVADDAGFKVPFSKTRPLVSNNYWFRYRALVRSSRKVAFDPEYPSESLAIRTSNGRKPVDNFDGVLLHMLGGYAKREERSITDDCPPDDLSAGCRRIPIREPIGAPKRYRVRQASIPFWDWPGVGDVWEHVSHSDWHNAMTAQLE